ncbi:hypothetical protein FGG08_002273 [Glutinoglossum americanum]|uniref:Uncharacterized protein n=1 Tax=Glutinoglossum americanum TaxID=1670608 RepID=A0A9P8L4M6_9PEZI|nr:hypothetical protein FGG08_002273 [Glutinoglossum americanum]
MLEAQNIGKVPQLCTPGSMFLSALASCEMCIDVHTNSTGFTSPSGFQQFLDYCSAVPTPSSSTTGSPDLVSLVAAFSSALGSLSAYMASHTLIPPLTGTGLATTLGNTTASLPSTVSIATARETSGLSSLISSPPLRTSRKWVIGAVVGPLIFITIGAVMGWIFLRKRYKFSLTRVEPEHSNALEDEYKDKPMLHADSIKPAQVGNMGVGAREEAAELPAREGVGPELAADELRDRERGGGE